ncbi:uncharacterized protein LOC122090074 [Macadamia integrifolia]|uniref:uncharacterized protein LOC122090074 n=1 Tax=Macadamia integrifolia TaxID=60698 RepID=UPI001C4F5202|nr:uncharacterized protein LOC122090074 [Macadamia integrifolia]XP_042515846.1 uncharacterized protein LOC122090074 [Macadamia integrifolia]
MATSEVSNNVHDHGTPVDEKKKRVRCNYCAKEVSGFSRLKQHLGGIRGDVLPCQEVPVDVKVQMKNSLLARKKGDLSREVDTLYHPDLPWRRNWCPKTTIDNHCQGESAQNSVLGKRQHVAMDSMQEEGPEEVIHRRGDSLPVPKGEDGTQNLSRNAQRSIGRFFYETGLDFNAAKLPSFRRMINDILGSAVIAYNMPSSQDLKGWILWEEVKEIHQYVKEVRRSWGSTGCSILLDGWTDEKGRNLVNFIVDCPRGPIFLRSANVSGSVGDVNALQSIIDNIIEEVGLENVVQIVTYTTSGYMEDLGKLLMEKYRTIFWTVCASHCIDLMIEKIGRMIPIKEVLCKAKFITKFVYSHATILMLLRDHTYGQDLVKTSRIKSAMPFLTLESIVSQKENLKNMFTSAAWKTSIWASKSEGKRVAKLVEDPSFWSDARMALKAAVPLLRAVSLIDGRDHKPQVGYIYETMDQAKETIKEEFKGKKTMYKPFWELIDGVWDNHLHSPLHSAGYFLNPSLFYSSDFFADAEVASGLLCCIVRLVEDRNIQDLISLQLDEYRHARGPFGQGSAIDQRTKISPALWWSSFGGNCPELQRFAIRILSQTCTAALRYELKRDLPEKLHTNGRNCIEQRRLDDLIFVHYNLRLWNFMSDTNGDNSNIVVDEVDPMNDWVVEGTQNIASQIDDSAWMDFDFGDRDIPPSFFNEEEPSIFLPKEEF